MKFKLIKAKDRINDLIDDFLVIAPLKKEKISTSINFCDTESKWAFALAGVSLVISTQILALSKASELVSISIGLYYLSIPLYIYVGFFNLHVNNSLLELIDDKYKCVEITIRGLAYRFKVVSLNVGNAAIFLAFILLAAYQSVFLSILLVILSITLLFISSTAKVFEKNGSDV
ncbi:hypothetical protein L5159_004486 [Vibrio parahaemolyticus]|nr:hypothetical protein [Vibrio parahaemolyticus]